MITKILKPFTSGRAVTTTKGAAQSCSSSWVNIANPFRGILVIGGAGSGKSYSVAEPIIAQAAQKGYCGIIYDFKFPTLTNFAYEQYAGAKGGVGFWVVNFEDLEKTHRVNPLNPCYIPSAAYASEYALAIINNLIPESIQKPDFWIRSAQALLTATIWYLRKHHPAYCTLPHVVNLLVGEDHESLLTLLRQDYECASMIRSIVTAVDLKASSQIAGMISSLQVALARINSPEICYVLSGDEFDLDINHPALPKILCVGSSPTLSDTFAPVIACLVAVATKQMNQQGKRHSFILLDEGPTLFIPKLDQLPATARSNKVATIYMAQDFSQMKKEYGQNESEAITSNLNNQLFGRVASLPTAEYVSKLFGRKEQLVRSEGRSDSRPESFDWGVNGRSHSGTQASSVSYSLQKRSLVHPQELLQLKVGQFMGTTVETENPTFDVQFAKHNYGSRAIPTIGSLPDAQLNFERIILETQAIVTGRVRPTIGVRPCP
jgi:type IV secretory pathway TraG/TraD family ATPase VirD4